MVFTVNRWMYVFTINKNCTVAAKTMMDKTICSIYPRICYIISYVESSCRDPTREGKKQQTLYILKACRTVSVRLPVIVQEMLQQDLFSGIIQLLHK